MRYFTASWFALCISAGITHTADQPKLTPAEQQVLNVSKVRMQANNRRTPVAWSRFVGGGLHIQRREWSAAYKSATMEVISKRPPEYDHSENPRHYVVHVYGNTAVLNDRATVHEQFTDSDIVSEMRMTETYIKPNGSWLLIARQWVRIPVNVRKPVAVDISIYKDYVGQYVWRPLDDVETLSVRDGKLWS